MMPWSLRRQIMYGVGGVLLLALLLWYPAYLVFHRTPSCNDGAKNQNETGVDCGGRCARACIDAQAPLTVNWVRFFQVGDGVYDIAASVENKNERAGIPDLGYTFTLYDESGKSIATKPGDTFINPREEAILFAPTVRVTGVPVRAEVVLHNDTDWYQVPSSAQHLITVRDQAFSGKDTRPLLTATIVNTNSQDLFNVEAVGVVYGGGSVPVGVSSTRVDTLPGDGTARVSFYWPLAFVAKTPTTGCSAPADVMLLIDRSGSMRGKPLVDALHAAGVFVDRVTGADQVGVVSFAGDASHPIDQGLSLDHSAAQSALKTVAIGKGLQYTNMSAAIAAALEEFSSSRARLGGKHAIVALTDGVANRPLDPKGKDEHYAETAAAGGAAAARQADISIYAVGLGREVNTDFLKTKIASDPSKYYAAATSGELEAIYQNIAQAVCKEELFTTKVFPRVNEVPTKVVR
ncbi:MAG: vWA domain-containing protein [Minisyncoccota bacterium]